MEAVFLHLPCASFLLLINKIAYDFNYRSQKYTNCWSNKIYTWNHTMYIQTCLPNIQTFLPFEVSMDTVSCWYIVVINETFVV